MTLSPIGFPAQPRSDLISRIVRGLRGSADIAREEAVTGRLADLAGAHGGQISELLGLEHSLATISEYREILDLAGARAGAIQTSLGSLRDLAVELHSSGLTALQGAGGLSTETLSITAQHALTAAVSTLNVSFGGRGLFAGDGGGLALAPTEAMMTATIAAVQAGPTGSAAYANLTVEFTLAGGSFDTGLYTGGTGDAPASEIAEGERIAFAPKADAAPIRALLRDIAALAAAFDPANTLPPEERHSLAENAVSGLLNGIDDLAAMSARIGTAQERMSSLRARHEAAGTALTQVFNKLTGRDQYEAAAELTQLEAQLQTSYIATARLASLSLASFLR